MLEKLKAFLGKEHNGEVFPYFDRVSGSTVNILIGEDLRAIPLEMKQITKSRKETLHFKNTEIM